MLENLVTTVEQSERLRKAGMKGPTEFEWINLREKWRVVYGRLLPGCKKRLPAYTLQELIEATGCKFLERRYEDGTYLWIVGGRGKYARALEKSGIMEALVRLAEAQHKEASR